MNKIKPDYSTIGNELMELFNQGNTVEECNVILFQKYDFDKEVTLQPFRLYVEQNK